MLEVTAIANKLGLPETAFEDETKFDAAFNDPKTGYIARARALEDEGIAKHFNDAHGKRMGQLESLTRKAFKEELEIEELESGPIETMLLDGAKKVKGKIVKLSEDAKKGNDTKLTELSTELGLYKTKYESEKERADKTNGLLKEKEQEFDGFKTNLQMNSIVTDAFKQVPLIPDITEIQRRGLNDLIREEYEFKVGDGSGEVWDRKTNKPAMNESGNVPIKVHEAISAIADKNGLLKKNNMNREPFRKTESQREQPNGHTEREPRVARNVSRLQ